MLEVLRGIYLILEKKWDMIFLLWENIRQKLWENFVLEEIEITILGKYWEILRRHSTCPNFFFVFGKFFSKNGKTLGTELLNVFGFSQI